MSTIKIIKRYRKWQNRLHKADIKYLRVVENGNCKHACEFKSVVVCLKNFNAVKHRLYQSLKDKKKTQITKLLDSII